MDEGSEADIRRRAQRRMWIMVGLVGGAAIVAVLAGFLTSASGEVSAGVVAVVTVAVVVGTAIPAALVFWLMRRRTGVAVSPLWGASRQVRSRVGRAIRRNEELPPAERELAVAEATRIRRLGRAPVVGFGIVGGLFAAQVALRVADGDPAWQIASAALAAIAFTLLAVQHGHFHRRAGAYLERFGPERL